LLSEPSYAAVKCKSQNIPLTEFLTVPWPPRDPVDLMAESIHGIKRVTYFTPSLIKLAIHCKVRPYYKMLYMVTTDTQNLLTERGT